MAAPNRQVVLLDSDSDAETPHASKVARVGLSAGASEPPATMTSFAKSFSREWDSGHAGHSASDCDGGADSAERGSDGKTGSFRLYESATTLPAESPSSSDNGEDGERRDGTEHNLARETVNKNEADMALPGTHESHSSSPNSSVASIAQAMSDVASGSSSNGPEVANEARRDSTSSEASSTASSESSLDELSPSDFAPSYADPEEDQEKAAMLRTIAETRKYLKVGGAMAFLQSFLPATASSEDIADLIMRLGFVPRKVPSSDEDENLMVLIRLLNQAMTRVCSLRPRLEHFYRVEHVLDSLRSAKNILVITGAGISTSLGIPDFRSSQGFYSRLSNLGLTDPQEVFDLEIFRADPSIFYSIAHMILPPDHVCAPLHKFIKLLQDKGKLLRNYTQNIDNLEATAGIGRERLIQCHGSFASATCVTCGYSCEGEKLFPAIRNREVAYCPKCDSKRKKMMNNDSVYIEESYGVMKPNITFFGEKLPSLFEDNVVRDLHNCDLVLSIGTSLKVAPVADMVEKVPIEVPQVLINKDPIKHCNFDVSFLGLCDDVVSYLCYQLGKDWEIEHPGYSQLLGANHDNLVLDADNERGVYRVVNREREVAQAQDKVDTEGA